MKQLCLILCLLWSVAPALCQSPYVIWYFDTQDEAFGQTAMADLNHDGELNLVFGCYRNDSMVYALNAHDGSLLWKYNTSGWGEGCNDAAPLIADANLDGLLEVIVSSSCNPKTYCFQGDSGNVIWETSTKGSDSPPTLGDVDGDGFSEILHGEFQGYVICLDASNGAIEWEIQVDSNSWIQTAPSLVDLDGDGELDFVVASWNFNGSSKVYAFKGNNHTLLWSYDLADVAYHGTGIADIDQDGLPELIIGDYSGRLYCLNGEDGSLAWTYEAGYYIGSPAIIADLDGNGHCNVIFTAAYKVIALEADGSLLWNYLIPSYEQSFRGVALADLTNDSLPDVVFGDSGGFLRVLKGVDGNQIFSIDLGAHYGDTFEISTAPVIADFNKDGILDAFVVGGQTNYPDFQTNYGRAYAVSLAPGMGPDWPMFQRDAHRTGSLCEVPVQGIPEHTIPSRNIGIQPNPCSDEITISIPGFKLSKDVQVDILSLEGSLIYECVYSSLDQPISTKFLPSGVYLLRIFSIGEYFSGKFVKVD